MPLQAVMIGPELEHGAVATGVVHSLFPHAVNIVVRDDLWTLLAAEKPDMPFGIRVAAPTLVDLPIRTDDRVSVRGGFMAAGKRAVVIDFRASPQWQVAQPAKLGSGLKKRLAILAKAAAPIAWRKSALMAKALIGVLSRESTLLADHLEKTIGQGPGLTPAGDDVIAGILVTLALPQSGDRGHIARDTLTGLLPALLPKTTSLSGYLLKQAAEGHFSKATRELLFALVAGSSTVDLERAIATILTIGATSGADMCMGIAAAVNGFLIPTAFEEAA